MSEKFDLDPLFDVSPKGRFKRFFTTVINARYLLIAIIAHIVALMLFGGNVVF